MNLKPIALSLLFLLLATLILYALWGLYVALDGPGGEAIRLRGDWREYSVTADGEERNR